MKMRKLGTAPGDVAICIRTALLLAVGHVDERRVMPGSRERRPFGVFALVVRLAVRQEALILELAIRFQEEPLLYPT